MKPEFPALFPYLLSLGRIDGDCRFHQSCENPSSFPVLLLIGHGLLSAYNSYLASLPLQVQKHRSSHSRTQDLALWCYDGATFTIAPQVLWLNLGNRWMIFLVAVKVKKVPFIDTSAATSSTNYLLLSSTHVFRLRSP